MFQLQLFFNIELMTRSGNAVANAHFNDGELFVMVRVLTLLNYWHACTVTVLNETSWPGPFTLGLV